MLDAWGKQGLLERPHRAIRPLTEGDEGETTAPPSQLLTHDRHVDNLAKSPEVRLNISLYTEGTSSQNYSQEMPVRAPERANTDTYLWPSRERHRRRTW